MYSLFLYDSSEHNVVFSDEKLRLFLVNIQFVQQKNNILVPADLFLQLLTFLGCSPNIEHEISIQITTKISPTTQAIGGDSINTLVCPNCKTKIDHPSSLLQNYQFDKNWLSPCCNTDIPLDKINWRKSAGFSQTFIQINNIFPKEAIPSDELLLQLSQFSQSPWKYFYSRQQKF